MNPDTLAQLHDIHLPGAISWWPLAPGWWLVAALLIAAPVVWVVWRQYRRRSANSTQRAALRYLDQLENDYRHSGDAGAFIRGISLLMRRYALATFPPEQVAGLTGRQWLTFLDRHGGNGDFSSNTGKALTIAPYRKTVDNEITGVAHIVRRWLSHNQKHTVARHTSDHA